jgi:hypothetical protein
MAKIMAKWRRNGVMKIMKAEKRNNGVIESNNNGENGNGVMYRK